MVWRCGNSWRRRFATSLKGVWSGGFDQFYLQIFRTELSETYRRIRLVTSQGRSTAPHPQRFEKLERRRTSHGMNSVGWGCKAAREAQPSPSPPIAPNPYRLRPPIETVNRRRWIHPPVLEALLSVPTTIVGMGAEEFVGECSEDILRCWSLVTETSNLYLVA
ncbi:hypothetical protein Trydic_g19084 [Trypoxylus dichotomus]